MLRAGLIAHGGAHGAAASAAGAGAADGRDVEEDRSRGSWLLGIASPDQAGVVASETGEPAEWEEDERPAGKNQQGISRIRQPAMEKDEEVRVRTAPAAGLREGAKI